MKYLPIILAAVLFSGCSATGPGGVVRSMAFDSATQSWRATMPDGSTAVYDKEGIRFEPALPTLPDKRPVPVAP